MGMRRRMRRGGGGGINLRREAKNPDTRLPASIRATLGLPSSGGASNGNASRGSSRGPSPRKLSRKRARTAGDIDSNPDTDGGSSGNGRHTRRKPSDIAELAEGDGNLGSPVSGGNIGIDRVTPKTRLNRRSPTKLFDNTNNNYNSSSETDDLHVTGSGALSKLSKLSRRLTSGSSTPVSEADDGSDTDKKETKRLEKLLGVGKKKRTSQTRGKRFSYASLFGEAEKDLGELADFCDASHVDSEDNNGNNSNEGATDEEPEDANAPEKNSTDPAEDYRLVSEDSFQDPDETTDEEDEDADCASSENEEKVASPPRKIRRAPVDDDDNNNAPESDTLKSGAYVPPSHRLRRSATLDNVGDKTGAYVPPSQRERKADADVSSDVKPASLKSTPVDTARLGRRIRGLLNRLADANGANVAKTLAGIVRQPGQGVSRSDVISIYVDGALDAVKDGSSTAQLSPFVAPHAAVAAHLGATVDMRVLASVLSQCVGRIMSSLNRPGGAGEIDEEDEDEILMVGSGPKRPLFGYAAMLGSLYQNAAVSPNVIHELVRALAAKSGTEKIRNTEDEKKRVEVLLMLFRQCGAQLRKEDPISLKNMIEFLRQRFETQSHSKGGNNPNATKISVMLELITAVKNNRVRKADALEDAARSKWAASVDAPLNATFEQLLDTNFTETRWWETDTTLTAGDQANDNDDGVLQVEEGEVDLRALAASLKLNTDYRRTLFGAIMSAASITDAFERVEKLGGLTSNKGHDNDTARVVLHCCAAEKGYNPFYALLAARMIGHSAHGRNMKFAFERAIGDLIKLVDTGVRKVSKRRVANYAQFTADLVISRALSIVLFGSENGDMGEAVWARIARTLRFRTTAKPKPFKLDTDGNSIDDTFGQLSKTEQSVANNVACFLKDTVLGTSSPSDRPVVNDIANALIKASNGNNSNDSNKKKLVFED